MGQGEEFSVEEDASLTSPVEGSRRRKGYFLSCGQVVICLIVVLILLIVVGVLSATFATASAKKSFTSENEENGGGCNNKTTTTVAPTKTVTTPKPSGLPYHNIRLPKSVKPIKYDLELDVDMDSTIVEGTVKILTNVAVATKFIMVHAHSYTEVKVKVFDAQKEPYPIVSHANGGFQWEENEYFVVEADDKFLPGNYSLEFEFSYTLRKDLKGFYLSTYKTDSGEKRKVAATQFEPVDARTAFPCFDEPSMKAIFDIKISHSDKYMALSNMPIDNTTVNADGKQTDQYRESPIMSTYLVVFVLCDFSSKDITTNSTNAVKMTYYAPAEQINQIDYAMEVGSQILMHFEEYYNVSYPLPKADMIAIPDFAAGAMENWGLITYRARALLFDPVASSISNRLYVASVVSHELAHQWFGNIVTMEWWSDLWLNEGFASYVEYIGMQKVHPKWNILDFQVITDMSRALDLDSLVSSHPIYIEVEKPKDIDEIFDSISYAKGGSILRMLNNFLGDKAFIKGLNMYLTKFSYKNAKTKDLWESLSEASKIQGDNYNVTDVMNSWIFQMGFPEIKVTKDGANGFKVGQSRFLRDRSPDFSKELFNSSYGYKWNVPFNYMTLKINDSAKSVQVVDQTQLKWMKYVDVNVKPADSDVFIKGNAGQYGFFRVNYDTAGWEQIIKVLQYNHSVFDVKDRAGILGDAFALANAGRLPYATALDLFDYIDKDTDYLPWKAASDAIGFIPSVLTATRPAQKKLNKYMLQKVSALYEKYQFNDNADFLERYLQVSIVGLACGYGHVGCRGNATMLFKKWRESGTEVPGDFRSLVYYYGMSASGIEEWDWMFDRFEKNKIASEKTKLLYGLSGIKEAWVLERYLHYALNESKVKSQDTSYVFSYVANYNSIGRTIAWSFLKENWDHIYDRFKDSFFTLRRIFSSVTSGFTTQYELDQMKKFVAEKNPDNGVRIIQQAEEKIKANIEWLKDNEKSIADWLDKTVA